MSRDRMCVFSAFLSIESTKLSRFDPTFGHSILTGTTMFSTTFLMLIISLLVRCMKRPEHHTPSMVMECASGQDVKVFVTTSDSF